MSARAPVGRTALVLTALSLLLLVAATLRVCLGPASFGWPVGELPQLRRQLAQTEDPVQREILQRRLARELNYVEAIRNDRLWRLATGAAVGVALAAAGVALQALLRNPLAEPFILGLSSGAGLGVMVQWLIAFYVNQARAPGGMGEGGYSGGPSYVGALLGALACMAVVFAAGRRRGRIDPLGLLLTGVVLSTINGAVIMLLNYWTGPAGLQKDLSRWMMGSIRTDLPVSHVGVTAGVILVGWGLLLSRGRAMDVASFSDAEALSLGVNLPRLRTVLFLVASLLAAAGVVLAGPVSFVGLICPHVGRLLLGPRHGPLLAASAILGAALVVLADALAAGLDLALHAGQMPLGIFTAMLGGPVFLWMLRPQLGRGVE